MPTIRIGYGSDFSIDSNGVGIGTTFAAANTKLDVVGALKGDFNVTGVTTLTAYGGFVAQNQHVTEPSTIGFATVGVGTLTEYYETETGFTDLGGVHHGDDQYFNTLSEDLVIDDGQILNITNTEMVGRTTIGEYDPHTHASYVCAGSLEQVSVTNHFSVPNGGTNDRQEIPIEGTVRFNTDLNTLEFFNGNEWRQFTYNQGQSGRAVFSINAASESLDYVNISTLGNAQTFGSLSDSRATVYGCASSTRGLWGGGATPTRQDVIDYITIASAGNAIDFGNLDAGRNELSSASSSTRGLWGGGYINPGTRTNVIQYVQISTIGNALDFGDLTSIVVSLSACASSTRALFMGGYRTSPGTGSIIDTVNIASKGDAVRFGDLTQGRGRGAGCSNSVRGISAGGRGFPSPVLRNEIDYVTIASDGNAIYFGDLTTDGTNARNMLGAAASQTRGLFNGGYSPGNTNIIDYITIMSAGNAQDFGDLTTARRGVSALSDSHGGLGGF